MDADEQQQMILAIDKKGEDIDAVTKAWIDAQSGDLGALGEGCRLLIRTARTERCRASTLFRAGTASSRLSGAERCNDRVAPERPVKLVLPQPLEGLRRRMPIASRRNDGMFSGDRDAACDQLKRGGPDPGGDRRQLRRPCRRDLRHHGPVRFRQVDAGALPLAPDRAQRWPGAARRRGPAGGQPAAPDRAAAAARWAWCSSISACCRI